MEEKIIVELLTWVREKYDLVDENWYFKDDLEGELPLSEEDLLDAWKQRG